ncbi:O-methyltransferase-domain-containing protein [Mycena olivaceomarginata]|nr:O-methyltransferase-domain-containing protein [Mycena olivaceomarginata]
MSGKSHIRALLTLINSAAEAAIVEYDKSGHDIPSLASTEPHPLDTSDDTSNLKKALRLLEGACDQLCVALAPPHHTMMNRAQNAEWACILIVIEARIVDALSGHPQGLPVNELSKIVNIEAGKLARILRLLATRNCFIEVDTNVFANNRLSLTLHSSNPVRDLAHCHVTLTPKAATVLYQNLTELPYGPSYEFRMAPFMHAVQDEGIIGGFFDWLQAHPEKRSTFGRAMVGMGRVMGSSGVLYNYDWNKCTTICDVGSGVGNFALPFSKRYPHVMISLLDLPGPISQAKELWSKENPTAVNSGKVQFVEADFFKPIPVKENDIYYLANILHNWPDAPAMTILKNVRAAMGSHSRLLIHEYVIQPLHRKPADEGGLKLDVAPEPLLPNFGNGNVRTHYQDFTMLVTYNSKERTLDEFSAMAAQAGLSLDGVFDMGETSLLQYAPIRASAEFVSFAAKL